MSRGTIPPNLNSPISCWAGEEDGSQYANGLQITTILSHDPGDPDSGEGQGTTPSIDPGVPPFGGPWIDPNDPGTYTTRSGFPPWGNPASDPREPKPPIGPPWINPGGDPFPIPQGPPGQPPTPTSGRPTPYTPRPPTGILNFTIGGLVITSLALRQNNPVAYAHHAHALFAARIAAIRARGGAGQFQPYTGASQSLEPYSHSAP